MTREIRKELNRAKRLYQSSKKEAHEIYSRLYDKSPEVFNHWDKVRYCWCIYYLHIKNQDDETELFENVEFVTDIIRQDDLNTAPVCVYTQCVFSAIMFLKDRDDWEYMLYWLDKLNPKLLSQNPKESDEVKFPSKKEDYYRYLSTAYFNCRDYEECIKTSREALKVIDTFAFEGDVWHKWRIGKSYNRLGYPEDALLYLDDVVKAKKDWYILKEIAECNYNIAEEGEAFRYAKMAVLANEPARTKVNLYYLIYSMLAESDEESALTHAKLFLALKLESGAHVPDEIEDLCIDEIDLDVDELEAEVRDYWSGYEGGEIKCLNI